MRVSRGDSPRSQQVMCTTLMAAVHPAMRAANPRNRARSLKCDRRQQVVSICRTQASSSGPQTAVYDQRGSVCGLFRKLHWKSRTLREKLVNNISGLFRTLRWNRGLFRELCWNCRTARELRRSLRPEICNFRVARYGRNHRRVL